MSNKSLRIFSINCYQLWVLISFYYNFIIKAADAYELFECGIQDVELSSDEEFVRKYEYPW